MKGRREREREREREERDSTFDAKREEKIQKKGKQQQSLSFFERDLRAKI